MTIYKPQSPPDDASRRGSKLASSYILGGVVFNPDYINKMDFCFQWIMGSDFEPVVRTRRYFRESPSITGVNFQAFNSFEIENLQGAREENPSLIVLNLILKKCRKLGDIVGMRMLRQDDIDP